MKSLNKSYLKNRQQHSNINTWNTKSTPNPFISISGYMLQGKYKNKKIGEVPTSYLKWVNNTIPLSSNERKMVQENI